VVEAIEVAKETKTIQTKTRTTVKDCDNLDDISGFSTIETGPANNVDSSDIFDILNDICVFWTY
jgi:hypothetical protein